jgi:hypothetical protein
MLCRAPSLSERPPCVVLCLMVSLVVVREAERLRRLIRLWLARPENNRTEKDLVVFYRWLEENRPELLKRHDDDEYRQLEADLRDYIRAA